jgi:uncharacterized membrane protein
VVLVTVICGVALWMVLNLLAPLAGYAVIDEPPFLWLFEALTLLGVVMGSSSCRRNAAPTSLPSCASK